MSISIADFVQKMKTFSRWKLVYKHETISGMDLTKSFRKSFWNGSKWSNTAFRSLCSKSDRSSSHLPSGSSILQRSFPEGQSSSSILQRSSSSTSQSLYSNSRFKNQCSSFNLAYSSCKAASQKATSSIRNPDQLLLWITESAGMEMFEL